MIGVQDAVRAAYEWFLFGGPFTANGSPAELTWTAMAALGLVLNMIAVYEAQGDLYLLRSRMINGARELVARQHRRNAAVRGLVKAGFLVIGIAALNSPPPLNRVATLPVLVAVFLGAIIGLTWVDILERFDRARLFGLMAHHAPGPDADGDGVLVIDRESTILSASRGAWAALGYAPGELEGHTLASVFSFEEYRAHRAAMGRYLATGETTTLGRPRHVIGQTKAGDPLPLEMTVVETGYGDARTWTVYLRHTGPATLSDGAARERARRAGSAGGAGEGE